MIRRAISPRLAMRILENMKRNYQLMVASDGAVQLGFTRNSGCPNSTVCPLLTRILAIVPRHSALMLLKTFIASIMQTSDSSSTVEPTCTNGLASGDEAV